MASAKVVCDFSPGLFFQIYIHGVSNLFASIHIG
jgi:hypothetical protein